MKYRREQVGLCLNIQLYYFAWGFITDTNAVIVQMYLLLLRKLNDNTQ